jgi:HSP20 family protein
MATTTAAKAEEQVPALAGLAGLFWLERMRDEFDRLCGEVVRDESVNRAAPGRQGVSRVGWRGALDVEEGGDAIVVRAAAPGLAPHEIEVEADDARLVIRARRQEQQEGQGGAREWRQAECYESITLPAVINKDKVEATYSNGVLTVTLPRAKGGGRKVPVATP